MDARSRGAESPWAATLRRECTRSADRTAIYYEVLGKGDRAIVLANGLGGRLYAWRPLIDACWRDYRLITWDYRGLFQSESPRSKRHLSVEHHCADLRAILREEGVERAALFGWSMGVQVSLDFASSDPERVAGLVLMNGTYGHVLGTGFQPLFAIPGARRYAHGFLEMLQRNPHAASIIAGLMRYAELPAGVVMTLTAGRRSFDMVRLLRQYTEDVLGPSFHNYLRLFQELDAHSVYHLLPEITAPTLVVSGALDVLTPAFQSRYIARRLPHAEHLRILRASHFALIERPERVVPAVLEFLRSRARWEDDAGATVGGAAIAGGAGGAGGAGDAAAAGGLKQPA